MPERHGRLTASASNTMLGACLVPCLCERRPRLATDPAREIKVNAASYFGDGTDLADLDSEAFEVLVASFGRFRRREADPISNLEQTVFSFCIHVA